MLGDLHPAGENANFFTNAGENAIFFPFSFITMLQKPLILTCTYMLAGLSSRSTYGNLAMHLLLSVQTVRP